MGLIDSCDTLVPYSFSDSVHRRETGFAWGQALKAYHNMLSCYGRQVSQYFAPG